MSTAALGDWAGERLLIAPERWLEVLRREYLPDYLKSGGSAVKVISGSEPTLAWVASQILEDARAEGFFTASLNAGGPESNGKKPDLHRIDRFFFAATRQVDWRAWAAAQAKRFLQERGIYVREGRALNDLEGIAQDNGRDAQDLLNQYQRELATPQIKDPGMAPEFRSAITALGRAQVIPDAVTPTAEEVLLEWLAGRTMPGAAAALKRIGIFERVNASNARHMLASFTRWLPRAGFNGLAVVLDFRPYEHKRVPKAQRQAETLRLVREAVTRSASPEEIDAILAEGEKEPPVAYSDAAYMQMLGMIRRFIDEIDWFERLLLIVLTSPAFYDSESRRNYYDYDALQTRIGLEVHDVRHANPAAALVHLGDAE